MRIVVVEDEIRIREGIGRLMQKLSPDYKIVGEAENGCRGLRMILELDPDVVITDIRMPEMDGLEMLCALHEKGSRSKAIVLSAYSEFEYARLAIKLGVKEYLLKPIVVSDFAKALERICIQMENEKKKGLIKTREQLFSGLLWGNLTVDQKLRDSIYNSFAIMPDSTFIEIILYLGSRYGTARERAGREMREALAQKEGISYCIVESEREKVLLVIVYRCGEAAGLERWLQVWMLQNKRHQEGNMGIGWIAGLKLEELKSGFETLLPYMDWNISLGDEVMISYPKITNLQTSPCTYPIEVENQMKQAVCANNKEKISGCMEQFRCYFRSGRLYAPGEIKECFLRFLWALMNTAGEVGRLNHEKLEQQKLLEQIMDAKTIKELADALDFLTELIQPGEEPGGETTLTVKRAQQMIREYYGSGITLDEMAGRLNITPEYLGTQFHKETGVTFSAYIKDFRIIKAKELLIGTQLKLYEIADKVGYADAKYFSRVFKEYTGQLPGEYRVTHR